MLRTGSWALGGFNSGWKDPSRGTFKDVGGISAGVSAQAMQEMRGIPKQYPS